MVDGVLWDGFRQRHHLGAARLLWSGKFPDTPRPHRKFETRRDLPTGGLLYDLMTPLERRHPWHRLHYGDWPLLAWDQFRPDVDDVVRLAGPEDRDDLLHPDPPFGHWRLLQSMR